MKLHIDLEWLERMAALEDDCDVGAGFELADAPDGFLTAMMQATGPRGENQETDADIRKYLGQETTQDIVDDVSRRFAADLDRIFGRDKSEPGGTGPIKGEDA